MKKHLPRTLLIIVMGLTYAISAQPDTQDLQANTLHTSTLPASSPENTNVPSQSSPQNLEPSLSSLPNETPASTSSTHEPSPSPIQTSDDLQNETPINEPPTSTSSADEPSPSPVQTSDDFQNETLIKAEASLPTQTIDESLNEDILSRGSQVLTHETISQTSPWEQFLIYSISVIRSAQLQIQSYSSIVFSKQGIPLLIILFGLLLLSTVFWFAYNSSKQEQQSKIKNIVKQKAEQNPLSHPLNVAYAEEASGDYDVFATSEGIPIKLDLAQAYINMQDYEGAETILHNIISQHRGKVVISAQAMLEKVKQLK